MALLKILLLTGLSALIVLFGEKTQAEEDNTPINRVHLGFYGLTLHGITPESSSVDYMPRKIDSMGLLVHHPELSMTVFTESSQQYNFTYLKDCLDKPAVNVGWGKYSRFKEWKAGFLLSLYARERFEESVIIEYSNGKRARQTVKAQQFLFSTQINNWEYIFLPMLTLSYETPLYKDLSFVVNGGSNFAITHINIGIGF